MLKKQCVLILNIYIYTLIMLYASVSLLKKLQILYRILGFAPSQSCWACQLWCCQLESASDPSTLPLTTWLNSSIKLTRLQHVSHLPVKVFIVGIKFSRPNKSLHNFFLWFVWLNLVYEYNFFFIYFFFFFIGRAFTEILPLL